MRKSLQHHREVLEANPMRAERRDHPLAWAIAVGS
jgi:hypothetical protein